jgi:solute carrier family 31 (copper transporter), member 1
MVNTTTPCPHHAKMMMSTENNNKTMLHNDNHDGHHKMLHSTTDHNLHDGMIMQFHGGYEETILFDFWQTKSIPIFLLSCFALFVMAILYEGLKLAREKLIKRELLKRATNRTVPFSSTCHCKSNKTQINNNNNNGNPEVNNLLNGTTSNNVDEEIAILSTNNPKHDCCSKSNNHENKTIILNNYSSRLLSKGHVIQTLLHMLQITVSYLLMLVFMTYNTWLCLSIVLGAGLGYFLFGLQRLTSIDVNEHCH